MFFSRLLHISAVVIPVVFSAGAVHAAPVQAAHAEVELIADRPFLEPGKPLTVALRFVLEPHWHIYWKNPGDSGSPAMVKWDLPEGFSAGEIQWPYPHRIDVEPLTSYGYENEVFLLAEIGVPAVLRERSYDLKARVDFLICEKICLPAEADVSLALPILTRNSGQLSVSWGALAGARKELPVQETPWSVFAYETETKYVFQFTPPSPDHQLADVQFFPLRDDRILHAAGQEFKQKGNSYSLSVLKSNLAPASLDRIGGVFVSANGWTGMNRPQGWETEVSVGPMPLAVPVDKLNILTALLFAFVGGIILNLMPCVLPVLSIKVLNLVEHKTQSRAKSWTNGMVFTLGVLMSFWLLAGILIALKAGGQQIGWGFQFQSPVFLIVLSVFLLVFALNLWGVFEVGTSLTSLGGRLPKLSGYSSHFMTGVLATIVATPCTAPFMGTAIGFALLQPWWMTMLIFSSLGLGMALPYLILAGFPNLLKFVPKPGRWMLKLKKILAVLLFLTVAWLLWVLFLLQATPKQGAGMTASEGLAWQEYSPELVMRLRQEGRPIFVDFTAAWCLTCQVNDRLVLQSSEVVKKFEETGVVAVKADWTTKDERITQALAEFGRNSIPFYVLYSSDPGEPPVILPEILSRGIVLDALDKITSQ